MAAMPSSPDETKAPTPPVWTAATIAEPVRAALESADLDTIGALLSPDVHWGAPGDKKPPCRNKQQVLNWYRNGRSAGARAQVTELTVAGHQLLVGLAIITGPNSPNPLAAQRWQVLTVDGRGVCDIRGHEDRQSAAATLSQIV
jgi:hypothetical protein